MTVNELKNANVKIRGYAMPDDYVPCFYKRCKLYEALDIMKDYLINVSEDFYNFIFTVTDEDDDSIFDIRRDLKTIYLEDDNKFNVTEDMIRKTLKME